MPSSQKQILGAVFVLLIIALGVGIYVKFNSKPAPVALTPVVEEVVKKEIKPKTEVIGKSVQGRSIESYTFGTGTKKLTFIGGIHGGYEWNSVLLAYMFIDYLNANPKVVPDTLTVQIIPSMNPDGLYKVTGKTGRFTKADVSTDEKILASGRFNANDVDLNRNFDCKWQPKSTWRSKEVSAGTAPFSEPESKVIQNFMLKHSPTAVVFWHSQSNAVYASKCEKGILPGTLTLMDTYALASGYKAMKTFDAYQVTGAVEDWLASINIPAVTVELKTHEDTDWEQNLKAVTALFEYYKK